MSKKDKFYDLQSHLESEIREIKYDIRERLSHESLKRTYHINDVITKIDALSQKIDAILRYVSPTQSNGL